MDAEAIGLSKENIQPLKRGRNASILGTVLQAQNDLTLQHNLMQKRDQFEILIRSYNGDDPLSVWYNYVQWVEQHFPKHGHEGNLRILLERCLDEFKNNEKYFQDVRFVDLCITYLEFTTNPLELYRVIHSQGIGTECALFYQCWAEEYEKANDIKHSDQIYLMGIERKAHPIDSLKSAHNAFEVRIARSVLNKCHAGNQNVKECRSALSILRAYGQQRNMVDSERVGNSVQHPTPGILKPLNSPGSNGRHSNTKEVSKVKVYFDENGVEDAVPRVKVKPVGLVFERDQHKENSLKAGTWNGVKVKQKSKFLSRTSVFSRPPFQVHEDDDAGCGKSYEVFSSNALKTIKEHSQYGCEIPLFITEMPDPNKRVMYQKKKVYSGGTEFSFEELRAISHEYLKKRRHELRTNTSEKEKEEGLIVVQESENKICNYEYAADDCAFEKEIQDTLNNANLGEGNHKSKTNQQETYPHAESQHITSSKVTQGENEPCFDNAGASAKGTTPLPFTFYVEDDKEMNVKLKPKHMTTEADAHKMPPPRPKLPPIDLSYTGLLKVPKRVHHQTLASSNRAVPPTQLPESGPVENDQSFTVHTKEALDMMQGLFLSPSAARTKIDGEAHTAVAAPYGSGRRGPGKAFDTPSKHFKVPSDSQTESSERVAQINVYVPLKTEHREPLSVFCDEMSHVDTRSEDINDPVSRAPPYAEFEIFTDTSIQQSRKTERQSVSIPFMPSPGMSEAALDALAGTDDKENPPITETNNNKCPTRRTIIGVLHPAKGIPCVPLEEQIHGEGDEGTTLSDETCCTEAFALPLISSTPCVSHHWQKPTPKEEQQTCSDKMDALPFRVPRRVERESFVILNEKGQNDTLSQKKSPAFALSSNQPDNPSNEDLNQEKESKQVALSVNGQNAWSLQDTSRSHLSTITELSEYRTTSSSGVSSGYSGGLSTEHHNSNIKLDSHTPLLHRRLEDRLCMPKYSLALESTNRRSSQIKENIVDFDLNDFRNIPFESCKLANSKYVKVNYTSPTPDDIMATRTLILETAKYDNVDIYEIENAILEVLATDALGRKVIVQFTNTSIFWDLYIREAIKARSTQYDMVSLWPEIQKVYVFEDGCVSVRDFIRSSNVEEAVTTIRFLQKENITYSVLACLVSKMMEVIHVLHRSHIVHGSLTNSNFKILFVEQKILMFLTDFKNALDLKLLPKEIKFRVSRSNAVLHTVQLSGYQIDYFALANCIHHLIFDSPLEVDEINGMWTIKNAFPSPYKEATWLPIFTELMNSNQPDLLKFSRTLQEHVTKNTELVIINIIKGGEQ